MFCFLSSSAQWAVLLLHVYLTPMNPFLVPYKVTVEIHLGYTTLLAPYLSGMNFNFLPLTSRYIQQQKSASLFTPTSGASDDVK